MVVMRYSVFWALLLLVHSTWTTQCFAPNGTIADSRFIPCIEIPGVHSMCCRLNDTDPDTCQSNGLCYWSSPAKYYRNYCTDEKWDSPNCLQKTICVEAAGGNSGGGSQVTLCPGNNGTTYCCGSTTDCCTNEDVFTLDPTLVRLASDTTATSTTPSTPTSTSVSIAATSTYITSPTTSASKSDDTRPTNHIAIGVGVGVSVGVFAAVTMLGAGFWWGKRQARARYRSFEQNGPHVPMTLQADSGAAHEIGTSAQPKGPFELSNPR
ncbi:hypothetical protein N7532_002281 [Penicillium argentinense]|uniref:Mid2 domain-containing protein n=1 Tax=Penicillium argentinense TaxID=1131581 RepID=A0A9W9KL35_9EURO|nr:uncharacterized protein N7532_002281 [Penicillium argentinense]KAJ5109636.1 hypothetical protein N7532_002281 [Penicillium argentinense]